MGQKVTASIRLSPNHIDFFKDHKEPMGRYIRRLIDMSDDYREWEDGRLQ